MKVLHVTYSFAPDPMGGTEVYVADLCRRLETRGIRAVIAAPGRDADAYEIDGLSVRRFRFTAHPDTRSLARRAGRRAARRLHGRRGSGQPRSTS